MDKRLTANADTSAQLSRSRNIMQATVTNGLLLKQIHDAMIQNVQATSLLTMTTAQAGLHEAEEAAAQRKEHQKTAVIFGALPKAGRFVHPPASSPNASSFYPTLCDKPVKFRSNR